MSFGFGGGGFGQNNQTNNAFGAGGGGGFGANTNTTSGMFVPYVSSRVIVAPCFVLQFAPGLHRRPPWLT
jgi:hypothetical protein